MKVDSGFATKGLGRWTSNPLCFQIQITGPYSYFLPAPDLGMESKFNESAFKA